MKIKQNTWFWILQISGWGLLFGTQIFAKLGFVKDLILLYEVKKHHKTFGRYQINY